MREYIFSDNLKNKYRKEPRFFTRNRKLPFPYMILLILKSRVGTMQVELHKVYSRIFKNIKQPTASAFYQNRKKINSNLLKDILDHFNDGFYNKFNEGIKLFKGLRLLAIDGSKLILPSTEALKEKYGSTQSYKKAPGLTAGLLSCLYDVLNKMVVDVSLTKYNGDERAEAIRHLSYCTSKDLIIFDRGYPSKELLSELEKRGIKYLMRSKAKFNSLTTRFSESNKRDFTELLSSLGKRVRLIKIKLATGEEEILLTNLYDEQAYPESIFKDLYFKRWGIETNYDVLKNILEIERFSSYSEESIKQDIYSTMFLRNYQSLLSEELEEEIAKKYRGRKYKYKVNTSISIGCLNADIIDIFSDSDPEKILSSLKEVFLSNVVPIIPERQFSRQKDKYSNRKRPKVLKNRKRVV